MVNYKLKSHLLEVVDSQLNMNDPACTRKTFNRLVAAGFEENETREMIASVLTEEMAYMTNNKKIFDEDRYAKKLSLLPDSLEGYDDRDTAAVPRPVRVGPSVGRNERCPCGSGKKYKKCCGN
ncbi:SEC-C metal-binding domain-containing protein [Rossellomorea vietnamensis]|uniref:SEC-C metal-binding domain-containing protein n=1 Tax=Rossellomorea vietnamensis TaxID=218284 RepID=UPI003CF8CE2B